MTHHPRPLAERFWNKVDRTGDCWIWTGCRVRGRYGVIGVETVRPGKMRMERVNRVAWRLAYGDIPEGMHVCHHCDNTPCVRPDHLFLGSPSDNMRDMAAKERGTAKLTAASVIEIRRMYATGRYTQMELGERFRVNRGTISYVLHRTWRHLPLRIKGRGRKPIQ